MTLHKSAWRVSVRFGLVAMMAALACPRVQASGLQISPLRLDLGNDQLAAQLELINLSGDPIVVQLQSYAWTQTADGSDHYEPSKDIFFAPPIVTIQGGQKVVGRFKLRRAADESQERAYRIYAQEVTPPVLGGNAGMQIRLRLGIPLFVAPRKAAAPALEITGHRDADRLELTVHNNGQSHIKITNVDAYPADTNRSRPKLDPSSEAMLKEGSNYILNGASETWVFDTTTKPLDAKDLVLIRTDDYSGSATKDISPAGYIWRQVDILSGPDDAHSIQN